MTLRDKVFVFFATGLGIGFLPFFPGTLGSVLALPLCYLLVPIQPFIAGGIIVIIVLLSMWIAGKAERVLRQKDPGKIVIDEIAGVMVTFIGVPFDLLNVVVGFLIFRIMDILKPYPARLLEKKLPGGVGVVMDDVVAGLYSNFLLRILMVFIIPVFRN